MGNDGSPHSGGALGRHDVPGKGGGEDHKVRSLHAAKQEAGEYGQTCTYVVQRVTAALDRIERKHVARHRYGRAAVWYARRQGSSRREEYVRLKRPKQTGKR